MRTTGSRANVAASAAVQRIVVEPYALIENEGVAERFADVADAAEDLVLVDATRIAIGARDSAPGAVVVCSQGGFAAVLPVTVAIAPKRIAFWLVALPVNASEVRVGQRPRAFVANRAAGPAVFIVRFQVRATAGTPVR